MQAIAGQYQLRREDKDIHPSEDRKEYQHHTLKTLKICLKHVLAYKNSLLINNILSIIQCIAEIYQS